MSLKFNFSHPFKGNVIIRRLCNGKSFCRHMLFDSKGEHNFEIPLSKCKDGKYRVILEWEFEGRNFFHQSEVLIKAQRLVSDLAGY